jgi:carbon storage regulator
MLVLTRREREAVLIDNHIVVTVTRIHGKTVRIAIDAPREVQLARLDLPRRGTSDARAKPGASPMVGV